MELQEGQSLVVDRLTFAKAYVEQELDSFIAGLMVTTKGLSDPLADSLVQIFAGKLYGPDAYLIIVSDNNELPIRHESENDAILAAYALSSNIINRYLYGLFSTYGVKPAINKEITSTLHFVRSKF